MNTLGNLFTDPLAEEIWDQYFEKAFLASRPLNKNDRQALLLEIKSDLYSSFECQDGPGEVERLKASIGRMGEPEEFIPPLVTDLLFSDAARTLNPRSAFSGLFLHLSRGFKAAVLSVFVGLGYILSAAFISIAVLKPIKPDTVGLFAHPNGSYTLGIFDTVPEGSVELLGNWVIPLVVVLAVLLYIVLTKSLRALRTNKRGIKR